MATGRKFSIDAILLHISEMSQGARSQLLKGLENEPLDFQQRAFVAQYMLSFNKREAGRAAHESPAKMLRDPAVIRALETQVAKLEQQSELTAEYVREYVRQIMEFCPTDYFFMADDGDWRIDPREFAKVPAHVRRLVESVEMKYVRNGSGVRERVYSVRFVSKTAALGIAVKLTTSQKFSGNLGGVPWEAIAEAPVDAVERRLEEEIRGLVEVQGPVHPR